MKRKRYTPNQKSLIVASYLSSKIEDILASDTVDLKKIGELNGDLGAILNELAESKPLDSTGVDKDAQEG